MPSDVDIEHTTFALMGPIPHTATQAMPCHCVIFRLADRVMLLDTGFGTQEMREPNALLGEDALWRLAPVIDPRLTALQRLEAKGLGPDDVTDIILTHLDNDHAGGLHDFPSAMVHVSQEELDSFDSTRSRGPYKPYQISRATRFATYGYTGERWFGLDARSVPLSGDLDLKLVFLPGHTLGHCGVAYREGGRWSLHAGDAYFDHRIHFLDQPPALPIEIAFQSSPNDRKTSLASLKRIRQQHADEVAMFCTHDQAEFTCWTEGCGRPDDRALSPRARARPGLRRRGGDPMAGVHGQDCGVGSDRRELPDDDAGEIRWFRFVRHDDRAAFEAQGWVIAADLG